MKAAAAESFLRDLISLIRPQNSLIAALSFASGWLFIARPAYDLWIGIAVLCLIHSAQTIRNDIIDLEGDRLNAPGRPLPSGRISVRSAATLEFCLMLAALSFIMLSKPALLIGAGIFCIVGWLYNEKPFLGSHRPVASMLLLAFYFAVIPWLMGMYLSGGTVTAYGWIALLGFALSRIATSLFKDFKDTKGDAATGKRTFLLAFGSEAATKAAAVLSICGAVLFLCATWLSIRNPVAMIPALAASCFGIFLRLKAARDPQLGEGMFGRIYSNELRLQLAYILWTSWPR